MNDCVPPSKPVFKLTLFELYGQWVMSQHILNASTSLLSEVSKRTTKAGLENALMHLVLDMDSPYPLEIFKLLQPKDLRFGFSCVGVELTGDQVTQLGQIITDATQQKPPVVEPMVRIDDNAIHCGKFTLNRNAPVERLWTLALEHFGVVQATEKVLYSALQYAALYAETRHIGPPQCVYDDFHRWGIRNEGFASPFNARLLGKMDSGFFSAFPQTDGPFGSRGSFFHSHWSDHEGAWCVDPPFLHDTLRRVDTIVGQWRSEGSPPILFIGPSSYKMQTPFDEEIKLLKGTHYYEGLDGELHLLPVDVSIWRFGDIDGFDSQAIIGGYLPNKSDALASK